MKIKGVTGGKMKGNPIEYTPDEKPALAVRDSVPKAAPEGELWWAESVDVQGLLHSPRGIGNKGFADNAYVSDGTAMIRRLLVKTDEYLVAVKRTFHIEFEDCCDGNGMPDLKVKVFTLA
jgi:hypothetical protein